MKIDLKKLKTKGITDYSFEFLYRADASLITVPGVKFGDAVSVKGDLEIFNGSVDVKLNIGFKLIGNCTRCLSCAERDIQIEIDETFFENRSDEGYVYTNDILDLTECADQALLLNMPYVLLCSEDCKGLCGVCGKNLNIQECKCK